MDKYEPLRDYLENIPSAVHTVHLTFDQIEKILDDKLPPSAYQYREWWANPSKPTQHPYAQSWLAVGWVVDTVDQQRKVVQFNRRL